MSVKFIIKETNNMHKLYKQLFNNLTDNYMVTDTTKELLYSKNKELNNKNKELIKNQGIINDTLNKLNTNKRKIEYSQDDYIQKQKLNKLLIIISVTLMIILIILIIFKYKLYNFFILKL